MAGLLVLLLSPFRGSRALRVLLPLVASVCCVIAMLVLAGQTMTILHLVGLLLSVAVGSNYALFFGDGDDDPAGGDLALHGDHRVDEAFGANTPTQAPAGHGIAFRDAVHD